MEMDTSTNSATRMKVHLEFIGNQEFPGYAPMPLYNLVCPGNPYNGSTRSLAGLDDLCAQYPELDWTELEALL